MTKSKPDISKETTSARHDYMECQHNVQIQSPALRYSSPILQYVTVAKGSVMCEAWKHLVSNLPSVQQAKQVHF